jgi:hypothetical protein
MLTGTFLPCAGRARGDGISICRLALHGSFSVPRWRLVRLSFHQGYVQVQHSQQRDSLVLLLMVVLRIPFGTLVVEKRLPPSFSFRQPRRFRQQYSAPESMPTQRTNDSQSDGDVTTPQARQRPMQQPETLLCTVHTRAVRIDSI